MECNSDGNHIVLKDFGYAQYTTLDSWLVPPWKPYQMGLLFKITQERLRWRDFCDREKLRRDNP